MYQSLLTRRYLTSKIMPLLAALAVTLCVATELIVWSVMGGFLNMLKESGRSLIGDVGVTWPNIGFPHYDEFIAMLRDDRMDVNGKQVGLVAAAAPVMETAGLLSLDDGRIQTVLVKGIDGESFNSVTKFHDSLWWRWLETPLPKDKERKDPRVNPEYKGLMETLLKDGRRMQWTDRQTGQNRPAIVLGIEVISKRGLRTPGGWIEEWAFVPGQKVTLSVVPLDLKGRTVDVKARPFTVANEVRSGLFELDANVVYVELGELQRLLGMQTATRVGPSTGSPFDVEIDPATGKQRFAIPKAAGADPARVTSVFVRAIDDERAREAGLPPVTAEMLRDRVVKVYRRFAQDRPDVPGAEAMELNITTWEDRNRTLIGAVEKETGLVMFIFGIISLTSVFLVLAIFWSMVSEKTKDIGVLRSLGAGRAGVTWLWLRYGLAIGLSGSILGLTAAYVIVLNINPIHEWLGHNLGFYVWDPRVYYFTDIPSKVVPVRAEIIFLSGIAASVLGALVPAVKAAFMDPVRALRFE